MGATLGAIAGSRFFARGDTGYISPGVCGGVWLKIGLSPNGVTNSEFVSEADVPEDIRLAARLESAA